MVPRARSGAARARIPSIPQIADFAEATVPTVWKGARSLFNFKSAEPQTSVAAVPAAYQTVLANAGYISEESPCMHPSLGLAGVRFRGSQYLAQSQVPQSGGGNPGGLATLQMSFAGVARYSALTTSAYAYTIFPVQPWNFGGQLGIRAFKFQRYRFNSVGVRYVSTCGVAQPSSLGIGYYKDWAAAANQDARGDITFPSVADLTPNIVFPVNVAQAAISVPYRGPELYYVGSNAGAPWAPTAPPTTWGDAQNRQEVQGAIVVTSDVFTASSASPVISGNLFLDYDIEFYDPLPAEQVVPTSAAEFAIVRDALLYLRGKSVDMAQPGYLLSGTRDVPSRVSGLLSFLGDSPAPSRPLGSAPVGIQISESKDSDDWTPVADSAAAAACAPQPTLRG
jgi:hypothetical protein